MSQGTSNPITPVSQSGVWNVTNVTGTVVLPTGASTSAKQDTIIGHLDGVEGLLAYGAVVGGGTEASALRVTLANNSTGVVTANLAAGTNYVGKVRLTDGTTDTEVVPLTGYNALAVALVDTDGNQIASFGGGTQYTEDAAGAANPVGTMPVMIRQDTPAALVTTDGDVVAQRATNYGAAFVQIVDSSGNFVNTFGGGTQYTQGDTDASITGTAMMMEVAGDALQPIQGTVADGLLVNLGANNDVTVTGSVDATNAVFDVVGGGVEATALRVTLASDSTGVLSVDDNGGSLTVDGTVAATQSGTWVLGANSGVDIGDVTINNAAGASAVNIQDGGNSITVDGTVAATQSGTWNITNISGTVSLPTGAATAANQSTEITSLQLLDDVVVVLGTDTYTEASSKGYVIGAVRRDADTTLVNTTNEYGPLQMDANGRLKVEVFSGETLPVSGTVAATQSGTWILGANSGVDIGDVTINNAAGASAVNIQDGGNSITVDGTVAATQSGTWNITNVSGTVSLPTGASTLAEQQTQTTSLQLLDDMIVADNAGFTDGTTKLSMSGFIYDEVAGTALTENDAAAARIDSKRAQIAVLEDATTRGRWATVTAANALKVDGSAVTQPVSGTVTANLAAGTNNIGDVDVLTVPAPLSTTGGGTEATALRVTIASDSTGVLSVDDNGGSLTVDGTVTATSAADDVHDAAAGTAVVQIGAYASDTKPTAVTAADAVRLNATLEGALVVKEQYNPTATLSNVVASATSVTILAANTNREGATIFNDSTVDLYLKFGATASTTSFTVKMRPGDYYEVPFMYSGIIDGIWDSATGNARVTEIT